jgi:hypothetical protein
MKALVIALLAASSAFSADMSAVKADLRTKIQASEQQAKVYSVLHIDGLAEACRQRAEAFDEALQMIEDAEQAQDVKTVQAPESSPRRPRDTSHATQATQGGKLGVNGVGKEVSAKVALH